MLVADGCVGGWHGVRWRLFWSEKGEHVSAAIRMLSQLKITAAPVFSWPLHGGLYRAMLRIADDPGQGLEKPLPRLLLVVLVHPALE